MKKTILLITSIIFIQTSILSSSFRGVVDVDVVSVELIEPSLKITVSENKSTDISVSVRTPEGNTLLVEKENIFGAQDFFSSSVRLIASGNGDNGITKESLFQDGFTLSFSFGSSYVHGSDEIGKRVTVFAICRIFFREGKFTQSEIAIPEGDYANKWKSVIIKDGKVTDTITLDDGIHCKWSKWRRPSH